MSDPPSPAQAVLPAMIGVVVIFAILVVVLWRTGVFDKNTSASDASVVAAMITLLGGLVASAFSLVGLLLKNSLDWHSVRVARESERNRRLEAKEIEDRMRLETSIKALELLTADDGQKVPPGRQSGALFVLGSEPLQQLDLALALLIENWRTGTVSSSAAVWLIDRALKSKDSELQIDATTALLHHVDLLPSPDGSDCSWPACADLNWPGDVDHRARAILFETFTALLTDDDRIEWSEDMLNWFVFELDVIRKREVAQDLRSGGILLLAALLARLMRDEPDYTIISGSGRVKLSSLRDAIAPDVEAAWKQASAQVRGSVQKLRRESDARAASSKLASGRRPVVLMNMRTTIETVTTHQRPPWASEGALPLLRVVP